MAISRQEIYAGPLPHPDDFARYGEVVPTAPERILTMAEKFAEHHIRVANRASWTESSQRIISSVASAGIAVFAIQAGRDLIAAGHDVKGLATILVTLGVLFGALRAGVMARNAPTRQQRRALERQRD